MPSSWDNLRERERALVLLAQRHGVQTKYKDGLGVTHRASEDTLLAVLAGLGVPVHSAEDAPQALMDQTVARWRRVLAPVTLVRASATRVSIRVTMQVPAAAHGPVAVTVAWEEGGAWGPFPVDPVLVAATRVAGETYQEWRLVLPMARIPLGYHRLIVEVFGLTAETLVIAPPGHAAQAPAAPALGVFCPPYALADSGQPMGSYEALARLAAWAGQVPAFSATLPLLPTWLEGDMADASPYRPVTRLFWSEAYLAGDPAAGGGQPGGQDSIDWPAVGRARRAELERRWRAGRAGEADAATRDYAAFRAYAEAHPTPWQRWPEPARGGRIPDRAVSAERVQFYCYAAQRAQQAMRAWTTAGPGPMLDFPVGVHPAGYDVWRWRHLFGEGMSMGAPPDALSSAGQRWDMPPLVPAQLRRDGYQYWRRALAEHLQLAGVLRVDHVMGLHRLLWIPEGASAEDGAYVQYPADELYAVLTLESERAGTPVVGEDLGNVPAVVRRTMAMRDIHRLVVVRPARPGSQEVPPAQSLVTTGTHDMTTFASMWATLSREAAASWCEWLGLSPATPPAGVHRATMEWLAGTHAAWVVVNLEDWWLEREAPNQPGTQSARNWSRRAARTLDQVLADEALGSWLRALAARRVGRAPVGEMGAEARAPVAARPCP